MRWPAEWEPHEAVWIGFPGNPTEWPEYLAEAQQEVAAFANIVGDQGRGEQVLLVCRNAEDGQKAQQYVDACIKIVIHPFGDIWLRDTGPIIAKNSIQRWAQDFGFNGWGGKFDMAGDQEIGRRLADEMGLAVTHHDWVLEGGAIDGDGQGMLITTEQCVLNPNRNPSLTKMQFQSGLKAALGVKSICWFGDGLIADHTDGHVDNLARFVAAGTVTIAQAEDADDPNGEIFDLAAELAEAAELHVLRMPSVGKYEQDGALVPASYLNFYIGNNQVVVPQYGTKNDGRAIETLASYFPSRTVIGLSSQALLRGGGSFHCISQQVPAS
ncbi:MAG: agmatine deiminase family protein [Parasphingorhabdus sp.]|uniref:agmatine deiminase family protein n=1 Tax=Parasphingorhabdus sp. TaxID=2709688 RepID=UPI0032979521